MTLAVGGPLFLVGAGKMGGALLTGWLGRGLDPETVFIQDPATPDEVSALVQQKGMKLVAGAGELPAAPGVMVLAIKPQMMEDVLPSLKTAAAADTVVLSIAAGTTIAVIERHLGSDAVIVRAMPNTPAAIGRGISVAFAKDNVSAVQKEMCDALLQAAGAVAWTDDEANLDAVTAVSGSGPAYVFLLAECLEEAAVEAGLERDLARQLARETVSGAGELLRRSDAPASQLRENVTSPGGTTAAALDVLTGSDGLQDLLTRAVKAATRRSRELSS
ncbi:MAG: pyrroline-5-carboxylate reductase [Pseudomonadota bacterium]